MLLSLPLLAVAIGTVLSHGRLGDAHGLALVSAVTFALLYRTVRPFWIPSGVRH